MDKKVNISIVGGSGYTGIELLRLLCLHPNVQIHHITSRKDSGKFVHDIYPSLRSIISHKFVNPDDIDLKESDLVFFAHSYNDFFVLYQFTIFAQCSSLPLCKHMTQ